MADGSVSNVIYKLKAEVEGEADAERLAKEIDQTGDAYDRSAQDAKEFENATKGAGNTAQRTGQQAAQATPQVRGLGSSVASAAKNFLAFASVDVLVRSAMSAVRAGIDDIIDFEDALAELSSITGATGGDLEFLKNQAREVGTTSTVSAQDAVRAFTAIGSARPDLLANKEALAAVTKESIALAEAAKIDLADAGAAVAGAMNQFGLGASEASRIVNTLAAGSLAGAADINDLRESVDKVGTVLAANNIPLEQGVGLLETLAEKELKGAQAGTQLRNITLRLVQAGKGFVDGQFDIIAALTQTKTELDAIEDPAKRAEEATKLFGLESSTAGNILLENVDKIEGFTKAVTGTTVAYEQQRKNTETVRGALAGLRNAYQDIVLSFEGSTGTLRRVITFFSENLRTIVKVMGIVIAAFGSYVIASKAATLATIAYRGVVSALGIAQAFFTGGVKAGTEALKGFGLAVKASPVGLLVSLLTTAVSVFAAFSTGAAEAAEAQRVFNEAQEQAYRDRKARRDLDKSLEEQVANADKLNAEQLASLKQSIDGQIAEYDRLQAARIGLESKTNSTVEADLRAHEEELERLRGINTAGRSDVFLADLDKAKKAEKAAIAEIAAQRKALQQDLSASALGQQRDFLQANAEYIQALIDGIEKSKKKGIDSITALEEARGEATKRRDEAPIGSNEQFDADRQVDQLTKRIEAARAAFDNVAKGSIADLNRQRDELAKRLRENLVAGSEAYQTTFAQYVEAAEKARKAEEAMKLPDKVLAEGSIGFFEQQLSKLNEQIKNVPEGEEFNKLADAILTTEAALKKLRDRLKEADPSAELKRQKDAALGELAEEKRHFDAISELDDDRASVRIAHDLDIARRRLLVIRDSNKAILDEIQRAENEVARLERGGDDPITKAELEKARKRLNDLKNTNAAVVAEVKKAQNEVEELELALKKGTGDEASEDFKQLVSDVLEGADLIAQAGINAWRAWSDAQREALDIQIRQQEEKVNAARELADRGNAFLLEAEKEKLRELNEERRRSAERNVQIAQVEAAANAVVAITRAAAEGGGWLSAVTIAATIAALVAGIVSARQTATDGVPTFKKGGVADWSTMGGYTGGSNANDRSLALGGKPYHYHQKEFVMDAQTTAIGNNLKHFDRIQRGRVNMDHIMGPHMGVTINKGGGTSDEQIDRVVMAVRELPRTNIRIDKDGLSMMVTGKQRRAEAIQSRR